MDAKKNHFAPEHHEGVYTLWNELMTPEVEDPLLDHFVYTLLDNVIVYGHSMELL
jgi:hypothetical protein